jgi:AcrR family transcriptional regulator
MAATSGAVDGETERDAVDRRRLRTERGRELVVTALLEFFDEGESQPGAARIAERAGVSERSVFRYFADLDALAAEAVARQMARTRDVFSPPSPAGGLDRRIRALVDQRMHMHDRVAVVAAAGRRIEARAPVVAEAFAFRRRLLREQVEVQFAPELDRRRGRTRMQLLDAADAAASFEQIDHLRTGAGWSRARTRAAVAHTLHALFAS